MDYIKLPLGITQASSIDKNPLVEVPNKFLGGFKIYSNLGAMYNEITEFLVVNTTFAVVKDKGNGKPGFYILTSLPGSPPVSAPYTTSDNWTLTDLNDFVNGLSPQGTWDASTFDPGTHPIDADAQNGYFWVVIGAPSAVTINDASIFNGTSTDVNDGDWLLGNGTEMEVIPTQTPTLDQIRAADPGFNSDIATIMDGGMPAHTHADSEVVIDVTVDAINHTTLDTLLGVIVYDDQISQSANTGTEGDLLWTFNQLATIFKDEPAIDTLISDFIDSIKTGPAEDINTEDPDNIVTVATALYNYDTKTEVDGKIASAVLEAGGIVVENEGTPVVVRQTLNFVGDGVTVTDDVGNSKSVITIPGATGDVTKVGTQASTYLGVWDSDGGLGGSSELIYNNGVFRAVRTTGAIIDIYSTGTTASTTFSGTNDGGAFTIKGFGSAVASTSLGTTNANTAQFFTTQNSLKIFTSAGTKDILFGTNNILSATISGTNQNWDFQDNDLTTTGDITAATFNGSTLGDVTAASNFGTDNSLILSDGTSKGVQSSGSDLVFDGNSLEVRGSGASLYRTYTTGTNDFSGLQFINDNNDAVYLWVVGSATAGNTLGAARAGTTELQFINSAANIYTSSVEDIRIGTNSSLSATIDGTTQNWDLGANDLTTTGSIDASNLDGIIGANTPAALTATTGTFSGDVKTSMSGELDGSNYPKIIVDNTLNGTGWTVGSTIAAVEFNSQDGSGLGAGKRASIEMYSSNTVNSANGLRFLVNDNTSLITALNLELDGSATFSGDATVEGTLSLGTDSSLTISGGEITVTKSLHLVDTEASAATDDLDTINGGTVGDILVLCAKNVSRTIVLKDATGNMRMNGDFSLTNNPDTITFMYHGAVWKELSRSDNGA